MDKKVEEHSGKSNVRPLVQARGDWIVTTVNYEQHRCIRLPKIEETATLLVDDPLQVASKGSAQV
jgi:hypothetical protein